MASIVCYLLPVAVGVVKLNSYAIYHTRTAKLAAETAAYHRLRGSDAVYAAVALRFGSLLVTLDTEQGERLKDILSVYSPSQALEML